MEESSFKDRIRAIQGRVDRRCYTQTSQSFVRLHIRDFDPDDLPWLLSLVNTLQIERNAALKLLGYDEAESDLLANITRLKAHYEQELAYLREGSQNLQDYCDRLIAASDPVVAVSTALNTLSRQQDEKTTKPERNP